MLAIGSVTAKSIKMLKHQRCYFYVCFTPVPPIPLFLHQGSLKRLNFVVARCEAISVVGGGLLYFRLFKNRFKKNGWSKKVYKNCK